MRRLLEPVYELLPEQTAAGLRDLVIKICVAHPVIRENAMLLHSEELPAGGDLQAACDRDIDPFDRSGVHFAEVRLAPLHEAAATAVAEFVASLDQPRLVGTDDRFASTLFDHAILGAFAAGLLALIGRITRTAEYDDRFVAYAAFEPVFWALYDATRRMPDGEKRLLELHYLSGVALFDLSQALQMPMAQVIRSHRVAAIRFGMLLAQPSPARG